jgi:hypothetical protein
MSEPTNISTFPSDWQMGQDFEPREHLIKIERYDRRTQQKLTSEYLTVQNRLLWFIRDQRTLIASGLAKVPYTIQTDLVELDRQRGWAHFKTYIRDVLGNEVTMYGSEAVSDFPDFAEKASTKSLGRALLLLGYGTAFAIEMDEGDRIVDTPVERSRSTNSEPVPFRPNPAASTPARATGRSSSPAGATTQPPAGSEATAMAPSRGTASNGSTGSITSAASTPALATDRQLTSIRKLCTALNRPEPDLATLTFGAARELLTQLSHAYSEARHAAESGASALTSGDSTRRATQHASQLS